MQPREPPNLHLHVNRYFNMTIVYIEVNMTFLTAP